MKKTILAALAVAAAFAVAPAFGADALPIKIGTTYTVAVAPKWVDISRRMPQRAKGVYVLSADGPRLNRLYVTDAIAVGGFMIKPLDKEKPTPTYRAGMSPIELVEFVTDTVAALEYMSPEADAIRPVKYGEVDGVRFDLKARTKEGLEVDGTAVVAELDGKAYVMLFLAPREHYYAAALPDVEAAFSSATLKPVAVKKK